MKSSDAFTVARRALALIGLLTVCACSKPVAPPATTSLPPAPLLQETSASCGTVQLATQPLSYCIEDPAQQLSRSALTASVLYYWHGIYGSEREVNDAPWKAQISALHLMLGDRMPAVIGLSVRSTSPLAENADEVASALRTIETRFAAGKSIRRLISGASMGGHSALRLTANRPEAFEATIGLCPALADFDITSEKELSAYIDRHQAHINRRFMRPALEEIRRRFPTTQRWHDNNPFTFLAQGRFDRTRIFLSIGTEDTLGLLEGTNQFFKKLSARKGIAPVRALVAGGHCQFDAVALGRFLNDVLAR